MNETIKTKKTILVVEDDKDINELICAVLDQAGYEPVSVEDGEEAVRKADKLKPDLVLLDIMLPKMDGIEVCHSISSNEKTKGIPIIMVTIKRDTSTKLESYIAGASRYITKPFGVEFLLSEIEKTLRSPLLPPDTDTSLLDPRD